MNLKIVKDTDPRIHQPSQEVTMPLSQEDRQTILSMMDYLKETQDPAFREKYPAVREGVGLAAPQIGVYKRMLVIYYETDPETHEAVEHALVNPKIVANSLKKCYLEAGEGCLSVDGSHPGYAYRDFKVTVKAFDAIKNEDVLIHARGFDAIVLQHEIDHLSGVFFYDRIDKKDPYKKLPGAVAI
jgi:peptide deformylase